MVNQLIAFQGKMIIQTMFVRGEYRGQPFDNTTEPELEAWMELLRLINPSKIMVYTIDRDTPLNTLQKVGEAELLSIATKVRNQLHIKVEVSG